MVKLAELYEKVVTDPVLFPLFGAALGLFVIVGLVGLMALVG